VLFAVVEDALVFALDADLADLLGRVKALLRNPIHVEITRRAQHFDTGVSRVASRSMVSYTCCGVGLCSRRVAIALDEESQADVSGEGTEVVWAVGEWTRNTELDYQWQLSHHLLPFFKNHHLSQITIAEVDRYRIDKVKESAKLVEALKDWQKRVDATQDATKRQELAKERPPRALSPV
jgi:hypothetical protein